MHGPPRFPRCLLRLLAAGPLLFAAAAWASPLPAPQPAEALHLRYAWERVDGLDIFYREGGPSDAPTLVLLHGAPASSIQYDELMQRLAGGAGLHVVAMDYPSFGYSQSPDRQGGTYTFEQLAQTVDHFLAARHILRFALYMQDFGVPVGFRLLERDAARVSALVIQNGVVHLDGFPAAQEADGPLRQHWRNRNPAFDDGRQRGTARMAFPAPGNWTESDRVNPDSVLLMMASQQRPGVVEVRNDLWFDYGSNVARYPQWQSLLRTSGLPLLVLWGSQDDFFTAPGALAYLRDAPHAEVHVLDATHFATLDDPDAIADAVGKFMRLHAER